MNREAKSFGTALAQSSESRHTVLLGVVFSAEGELQRNTEK
jgi:hypothetical protein